MKGVEPSSSAWKRKLNECTYNSKLVSYTKKLSVTTTYTTECI